MCPLSLKVKVTHSPFHTHPNAFVLWDTTEALFLLFDFKKEVTYFSSSNVEMT